MTRDTTTGYLYLLAFLILLTACDRRGRLPNEGEATNLQEIIADNVFLTDEGYILRLTEQAAKKKYGLTEDIYRSISARVEITNAEFLHYLDTLSTDDQIIVLFPEDKIIGYPDDRLRSGEDHRLSQIQLRDHAPIDYVCKYGFTVSTTINGGPATRSENLPAQTSLIRYSAGTDCIFGIFHGTITASGSKIAFTGSGFNPRAGSFSPGTDEGICTATIGSTGCTAQLLVCFWTMEEN